MSIEDIQGTWFVLSYLSGDQMVEPSPASREPAHLIVDGDRVAGSMGVNRIMGEIGDNGLPGPLATTMMAGPPELMEQETNLLAHLQAADSVEVDETGMTWSKDGLELVKLSRPGTDEPQDSSH